MEQIAVTYLKALNIPVSKVVVLQAEMTEPSRIEDVMVLALGLPDAFLFQWRTAQ